MKQLLFILFFAITGYFANAQTGTGTIDATNDVSIAGGDGSGFIASVAWSVQGTPPAPITISAPTNLKTNVTVTKSGDYYLTLTVKDNLGSTATGTYHVIAYDKQVIIIKVQVTPIPIILK